MLEGMLKNNAGGGSVSKAMLGGYGASARYVPFFPSWAVGQAKQSEARPCMLGRGSGGGLSVCPSHIHSQWLGRRPTP